MESGSEFGPYLIGDRLGSGGMGVVYRATDRRVPRTVALKILNPSLGVDPQYRERFRRESAVLSAAEHPHIVPMYGAGEIDGRLYLDMRYIDGLDMQSWLANRGPIPPRRLAPMIEGLADALDFVHSRGILHRDIKPSNIVLAGAKAFPYLLDFGIARADVESTLTQVNSVVGSLEYMAPERFEGNPADRRTDIYALTGVLVAAVTGQPPYPGCNEMLRALRAHCFDPVPRPSAVDPALAPLDEVVAHGMAKDPDARYHSAEHLAEAATQALERVGAPRPVPSSAGPPSRQPAQPMTRPPASAPLPTITPPPTPPPGGGFGPPTFTAAHVVQSAGPVPTQQGEWSPQPAAAVPAGLRGAMAIGAITFATLLAISPFLPQVAAGPFGHGYATGTKQKLADLVVPALVALAAVLFAVGHDRLFDFAAGLTIAGAFYTPAYALDLTRHVHFSGYPAGSGYKVGIAALILGLAVGGLALWSPGRRALRGRARHWPWIVGVAAAGLAADLIAFHQVNLSSFSGFKYTAWQQDKWAIGYLFLSAGTVIAALFVFGGRRIALGMLTALAVYSVVLDAVTLSYPGKHLFAVIVLASDLVVIAAGFLGWYTMPRTAQRS
jgi:serine/threonine-protein kinase